MSLLLSKSLLSLSCLEPRSLGVYVCVSKFKVSGTQHLPSLHLCRGTQVSLWWFMNGKGVILQVVANHEDAVRVLMASLTSKA